MGEGWEQGYLHHAQHLQATSSGRSSLYILTLLHILFGLQALSTSQGKVCPHVSPGQPLPTSLHSQTAASSRFLALEVSPKQ